MLSSSWSWLQCLCCNQSSVRDSVFYNVPRSTRTAHCSRRAGHASYLLTQLQRLIHNHAKVSKVRNTRLEKLNYPNPGKSLISHFYSDRYFKGFHRKSSISVNPPQIDRGFRTFAAHNRSHFLVELINICSQALYFSCID